jgi:hypothetical protein
MKRREFITLLGGAPHRLLASLGRIVGASKFI